MLENKILSVEDKKKVFGKIYKVFLNYKAKQSAKNKLNAQRVLKKYQHLPQRTMIVKPIVQEDPKLQAKNYNKLATTYKPKRGGLMTDRFRVRDLTLQENEESQTQAETIARETIGNRLLAHNYKRDYLQELRLRKEKITKAGENKTVREVLEEALIGMRDKLKAKKILEQKKLLKTIETEKKLKDISTSQDKIRLKNIYASVVEDATNSALSRLVELDGKLFVAKHLTIEAQSILPTLKKTNTLAQKLGLEERERELDNIKLFSSANIRNENMDLAMVPYTGGNSKRGRLVKGSQEAKDYMARIRAMRKTRVAKSVVAPKKRGRVAKLPVYGPKNRVGRPKKYTPPAEIVVVQTVAPKKRGRPAKLPVFGPKNRPGRPKKYTPPAEIVMVKKRGRPAKLPVFGPKNRVGRPRKYKP